MKNDHPLRFQSHNLNFAPVLERPALGSIGAGFAFTVFLRAMKSRFIWWPFHPAGYVLTTGEGMVYSWFAVFISWAVKLAILKHGGVRAYRKAVPFFLGLIILGDLL